MSSTVPNHLRAILSVNKEFNIIICLGNSCRTAQTPQALLRHLRDKHHTRPEVRKQVEEFLKSFTSEYEHSTVSLPDDGSPPQPILPIYDGFKCKFCQLRTRSRKLTREHVNKVHGVKNRDDNEMLLEVRLQTWFGEKREKY